MSKKKRALKRLKQFESFAAPTSKKKVKLPIATAEQVVDRFIKVLKSKKEPLDNKLKKIMSNIESAPARPDVKPDVKPGTKPGRVSPIPRKEPSVKPRPKAFAPGKEAPVKPDVKPGTKPGRVSPIPRKEPSVKPRPKAIKESIAAYVDDHGTSVGREMNANDFVNAICEFFQQSKSEVIQTLKSLASDDSTETLYLTEDNFLVLDQKTPKKILLKYNNK